LKRIKHRSHWCQGQKDFERPSFFLVSNVLSRLRNRNANMTYSTTYDHRLKRIGHPVRSAIHKPHIGRLVVGWVTTSEYLLLYVF
jgi:hypothetical protein